MRRVNSPNLYIGKRLKSLREDRNLTQSDLANKLGLNKGSISAYERDSALPSIEILVSLADIFGVSVDFILGREKSKSKNYYLTESQQDALDYLMKTLEKENFKKIPDEN